MRRYAAAVTFALIALHISLTVTATMGWRHNAEVLAYDNYSCLASNILKGQYADCAGVQPTAYRLPVYPAALAGMYAAFGGSEAAARLLQSVFAACVVFVVVTFVQKIGGNGIVAGLVACVSWGLYFWASMLMTEALFTLVLVLFVVTFTGRRYTLSGVLLGVLFLTRGTIYLAFPLLLLLVPRRALLRFAVPVICIVAMWVARNAAVMGVPVISTNGGVTLLASNNAAVYARANGGQEFSGITFDFKNELTADRAAQAEALAFVRGVPLPVLAVNVIAKELALWGFFEEPSTKLSVIAFAVVAAVRCSLLLASWQRRRSIRRSFGVTVASVRPSNR